MKKVDVFFDILFCVLNYLLYLCGMITYKYKLYKTKNTKYLDQMLAESCFVWNHALALQKRYYRLYKKYIDVVRLRGKWIRWFGKSKRLHSQTVQEILERLDKSYIRFFRHIQKRPPKFKKAKWFTSFVFRQGGYTLNGNVLTVNKIKKRYKFSLSRPYVGVGKIKTVTVRRSPLGDFYVLLSIEAEGKSIGKTHNGASVGIDFGLKTYMTLSDGTRIQSPQFLKQGINAKKKADRRMSRCIDSSNHRQQARNAKNRIEERITNLRDNWQWQKAHELCRKYDIICIEDLQLTDMTKLWGRKMQDLAHGRMVAKLEYLASRYGVTVKKVDRYFPSSKLCDCGHVYQSLSLHDRVWTCPVCGLHHYRDLHAANNILRQGIASLGSPCKTQKPSVTVLGRKHSRISRFHP